MSGEASAETGKPYGLERVCWVLDFPRSTIYAQQARESGKGAPACPRRRGPKPKLSDANPLVAIRADLESSPFTGEGHHKVWARLRILRDICASRARVLRLMREHQLLSPHRRPQGAPTLHTGNHHHGSPERDVGHRRPAYRDGGGGLGLGVLGGGSFRRLLRGHPCGEDRQSLRGLGADRPGTPIGIRGHRRRGWARSDPRMDHGTQYTSDDFLNQIRFWGVAPSFAFVAESQTDGVAERFNRTLKEQVIHGRALRNLEEVRDVVTEFKERYNYHWRLEKLGFLSPLEARQAYTLQEAA